MIIQGQNITAMDLMGAIQHVFPHILESFCVSNDGLEQIGCPIYMDELLHGVEKEFYGV